MRKVGLNYFLPCAALVLALAMAVTCAQADDRTERPQVAAATAEAVAAMRNQIEDAPLTRNMTVADFLKRVNGEKELDDGLARAELVGGPRWVDNDTCQVQLQMSGARVGRILEHIAANHERSPLSAGEISLITRDWDQRTFAGSGSSTTVDRAAAIRPPTFGSGWDTVSDADRKRAVAAAKDDAVKRVMDSIQTILLADGKTVGDVMASHPKVRDAVVDWLNIRPVLRVEYRRDMQIELTMAGTPDGVFDAFRRAVANETDVKTPRHEIGWLTVRSDFERQMTLPIGHATTAPTTAPAVVADTPAAPEFPRRAPAWIGDHIEVESTTDAPDSQLRAARVAEKKARLDILQKVNDLPFARRATVGQAARQDPKIQDAVAQAMDRAEIVKTDYSHKGKVTITLRLDLQDLWDALRSSQ
jgi:hypothetical protein